VICGRNDVELPTLVCHRLPIRPTRVDNRHKLPYHLIPVLVCISNQLPQAREMLVRFHAPWVEGPHLFGLALEALFGLVGPPSSKRRLPCVDECGFKRVQLPVFTQVGLDCRHYRPATCGRVFDVFHQGIVILFPTIERLATEIANNIVGAAGKGLVKESSSCKLQRMGQWTASLASLRNNSHRPETRFCVAIVVIWRGLQLRLWIC